MKTAGIRKSPPINEDSIFDESDSEVSLEYAAQAERWKTQFFCLCPGAEVAKVLIPLAQ